MKISELTKLIEQTINEGEVKKSVFNKAIKSIDSVIENVEDILDKLPSGNGKKLIKEAYKNTKYLKNLKKELTYVSGLL